MVRWMAAAILMVGATAGLVLGQTRYGVVVTPEKGVDYAALRTYTWRRGLPSSVKAIDAQITAAVDRELKTLGMTRTESGPVDVFVSYASQARTDVDVKGKPDAKGLLPESTIGTLIVAFDEPAGDRRLLRIRADLPVQKEASQLEAEINRVVAAMFAEYPTRKKK
jgi:hypothetical protein